MKKPFSIIIILIKLGWPEPLRVSFSHVAFNNNNKENKDVNIWEIRDSRNEASPRVPIQGAAALGRNRPPESVTLLDASGQERGSPAGWDSSGHPPSKEWLSDGKVHGAVWGGGWFKSKRA